MINLNGNIKSKDQEGLVEENFQPVLGEVEIIPQPEEAEILENKDA